MSNNYAPSWMSEEAIATLKKGYLQTNETPNDLYIRLSRTAASYYPKGIGNYTQKELEIDFLFAFHNGWLSPATPVASNFGSDGNGLAVSCFGIQIQNSVFDIFEGVKEAALLTKHGGGLGIDISNVEGITNVKDWAKFFDLVASVVSQNQVRRGAVALYLDVDHPDILDFLNAKDLIDGDVREKLTSNIGIKISKSFIDRLNKGDKEAIALFAKILEIRMRFGSPYLQFMDNCWNADPDCYKDKNLKSGSSQLCNEITLYQDKDHSYSCVLSSLNADKADEWMGFKFKHQTTLPELAIYFLDAVNEEFIQKAGKIPGFEKSVRGAIKGRPLGLGVLGLHSLYMKLGYPWQSPEASELNARLFEFIQINAKKASATLAFYLGECEWTKGHGLRNTHLTAIAPTTTNSVLCNAGSPGIEPIIANYFAMAGAKGTFTRQNKYLVELLEKKNANTGSVWASIRENQGSVQHLDFLSDHEKEVFKIAHEIDQNAILEQASTRQRFVCQGQSLNLFVKHDTPAQEIVDLHLKAEKLGLKGLYYLRSTNPIKDSNINTQLGSVFIETRPDCIYCQKAKELLDKHTISYLEEFQPTGKVPRIWINGELLDDGYTSLRKRFFEDVRTDSQSSSDCVSCEG
jgi:ribonucleoside-diphosphate reductase alpha chain